VGGKRRSHSRGPWEGLFSAFSGVTVGGEKRGVSAFDENVEEKEKVVPDYEETHFSPLLRQKNEKGEGIKREGKGRGGSLFRITGKESGKGGGLLEMTERKGILQADAKRSSLDAWRKASAKRGREVFSRLRGGKTLKRSLRFLGPEERKRERLAFRHGK